MDTPLTDERLAEIAKHAKDKSYLAPLLRDLLDEVWRLKAENKRMRALLEEAST
jgi:hypothetical protein